MCDGCAPPCDRCNLPIVTDEVKAWFDDVHARLDSPDTPVMWGNGVCTHQGHHEVVTSDPVLGSMIGEEDAARPRAGDGDLDGKVARAVAEREKATHLGCTLNVVAFVLGLVGWAAWGWYALPLAVLASVVFGVLYSGYRATRVRRSLGLTADEQAEVGRRMRRRPR